MKVERRVASGEGSFQGSLPDRDRFGFALAGLGDLGGAGAFELAVGAPYDDAGASGQGSAWLFSLRASLSTFPGDATFDGGFDNSDPISVLRYLFLDGKLLCPPAANYNGDAHLDTSDVIRMLGGLFLDRSPPASGKDGIVECQ